MVVYASFLAARFFFVERDPDEVHFAPTQDGWRIAVVRYRPRATPRRHLPVLLVHGLASNRYGLDLLPERSLAVWLAARGWDVWLVELRGRGLSSRPRLFSGRRYDWCFDDYVEQDLPAALAEVCEATGAPQLHLVGFSTGALAAYALLCRSPGREAARSLVSLAGPVHFQRISRALSASLLRAFRFLRHRWLMRLLAPVTGPLLRPLGLLYSADNLDGPTQRRMMVNLIANFSRNELLQYSAWLGEDCFRSIDQRRDYRAELGQLVAPTLCLAGARDPLAPPDAVKATFELLGAKDKQLRLCSRAQGLSANYGHFDLVLGAAAPVEVFPLVDEWLSAHDAPSGQRTNSESATSGTSQ
jgi:pimeloyl-ACP methyl ester carboxylesterase